MPKLRCSNRLILRLGLVGVLSVAAILLAFLGREIHHARRVAALASTSSVSVDFEPWLPGLTDPFLTKQPLLLFRRQVTGLHIRKDLTPDQVAALDDLTQVRALSVSNARLEGDVSRMLRTMTSLRSLTWSADSRGLAEVRLEEAVPRLESLSLDGDRALLARILPALRRLPRLRTLSLSTNDAELDLAGDLALRRLPIETLQVVWPEILLMDWRGDVERSPWATQSVSREFVDDLLSMTSLKAVELRNASVSYDLALRLRRLPRLEGLSFDGPPHILRELQDFFGPRIEVRSSQRP